MNNKPFISFINNPGVKNVTNLHMLGICIQLEFGLLS